MKRFVLLTIGVLVFSFGSNAQKLEIVKYEKLEEIVAKSKGLTVFNFWATWCRPCVAELPHFVEVAKKYKDEVTLVLVSLDFSEKADSHVVPFLKRKHFDTRCVLLDETDGEKWIPQIDKKWDGAIPATLVVNHKKGVREFYDTELSKEELEGIVSQFR